MWKRVIFSLVILAAAAFAYLLVPLPPEDLSDLATAADGYDARILRDRWGVPHIFGTTDADAAYGLAYAHSEDDFLTIQQSILAARGQLASVYGRDAAPNDYMVHLFRIADQVEAGYERDLSPETRALVEGYAAGLNHYAALHVGEVLPGLFPVTGRDLIAASVHKAPLFFGIDGTLGDLFGDIRPSEISQNPGADGNRPIGSNAIAVSPRRSDEGQTLLAVNSHQPWTGPVAWYEAHVRSDEGWDMVGALFPGTPLIIHGHNRDLGWAFTVNRSDLTDVYVLEIDPDDPYRYRFEGEWLELERRNAPIRVRLLPNLEWTFNQEVLWSRYGPVVRRPHGTYAIRYSGWGRVTLFEQLYRMNRAQSFDEWRAAVRIQGLPMFNIVYADRTGRIFYLYNALLPLRAEGYDWSLYLPGDRAETLWMDYLPFDDLPQVLDPESGVVQSTNNTPFLSTIGDGNPDPARYSPTLGLDERVSNRTLRVHELFGADESISDDDFLEYKYDTAYSTDSEMARYIDVILRASHPDSAEVRRALELLREWDLRAEPSSRAAALAVWTAVPLGGFIGSDAASDEEIVAAFHDAVDALVENYGRVDPRWDEVNRIQRGELDLGIGGAPDVLHAIYATVADDGHLHGQGGDSYILMVRWDADGSVRSQSIHQFGSATLDENSPHYADQTPLFARRELRPVWIDEAEIRANLEREYRPGEELTSDR